MSVVASSKNICLRCTRQGGIIFDVRAFRENRMDRTAADKLGKLIQSFHDSAHDLCVSDLLYVVLTTTPAIHEICEDSFVREHCTRTRYGTYGCPQGTFMVPLKSLVFSSPHHP